MASTAASVASSRSSSCLAWDLEKTRDKKAVARQSSSLEMGTVSDKPLLFRRSRNHHGLHTFTMRGVHLVSVLVAKLLIQQGALVKKRTQGVPSLVQPPEETSATCKFIQTSALPSVFHVILFRLVMGLVATRAGLLVGIHIFYIKFFT